MREITIRTNEAGQRLDKFLCKYMKEAPTSFFYKMLRKKNILLNGKCCSGNERLQQGDVLRFYLSEETLAAFGASVADNSDRQEGAPYEKAYRKWRDIRVVYEDEHILAADKPAGVLTQKAVATDLSLNEWLIGYLLQTKAISPKELSTFKPSVCNRLDRNTSGLVLCAKSLAGAQLLGKILRERSLRKFYRLFVNGWPEAMPSLEGWLIKDKKTNRVDIFTTRPSSRLEDVSYIRTGFMPLRRYRMPQGQRITYAEVELFTGKPHQIRAHLAALGYPLVGDGKYGNVTLNENAQKLGVTYQMLHAQRVVFPKLQPPFLGLSCLEITAPEPEAFTTFLNGCTET